MADDEFDEVDQEELKAGVMTLVEAGEYMSVSYSTIKNWVKEGLLESFELRPGSPRILKSEVMRFVKKAVQKTRASRYE